MKTRFLIIIAIAVTVYLSAFWNNQAYASCAAEMDYDLVFENSELVFTGTVTRLDNYDGPQKVTFFIHEVNKGKVITPKHVLENTGLIFHDNDTVESSSINVDYKIGKTYKVYVQNGKTDICSTTLTAPPSGYVWEPGPEDGNYYSENPEFVNPCPEGYGSSDGVCITLEEMNKDLPTCSANPRHDFGKCKKNMEEPPNSFEQVKASCNNGGDDIFLEWWDDDVYYNNVECELLNRDGGGTPPPILEPEPEQDLEVFENCGPGTVLQDGICVVTSENQSSNTGVKWGGDFFNEKLSSPNLEPSVDYDYGLIYMIVLLTIVIISGIVGGIIFVIRRKRK